MQPAKIGFVWMSPFGSISSHPPFNNWLVLNVFPRKKIKKIHGCTCIKSSWNSSFETKHWWTESQYILINGKKGNNETTALGLRRPYFYSKVRQTSAASPASCIICLRYCQKMKRISVCAQVRMYIHTSLKKKSATQNTNLCTINCAETKQTNKNRSKVH